MPSKDAGSAKVRATFAGVEEMAEEIGRDMDRLASRIYAASLRRAVDAIGMCGTLSPAIDKLLRLAEEEEQAVSPDDPRADLQIHNPSYVKISVDTLATAHDIAAVSEHYDGAPNTENEKYAVPVNLADLRTLRAMLPKRESEKEKAERLFEEYKEAVPAVAAPEVPMTPTIAKAQAAVAWMSARADDICGDEQRQEWAKQIVTLDRFLFRLSMRAIDPPHVSGLDPELLESATAKSAEHQKECDFCEGAGTISGFDGDGMEHGAICDRCGGSGYVPVATKGPVKCKTCRAWHKPPACTKEGAKT